MSRWFLLEWEWQVAHVIQVYVCQTTTPQQTGKQNSPVPNPTPNRKVINVVIWSLFGQAGVLDWTSLLPTVTSLRSWDAYETGRMRKNENVWDGFRKKSLGIKKGFQKLISSWWRDWGGLSEPWKRVLDHLSYSITVFLEDTVKFLLAFRALFCIITLHGEICKD